MKLSALYVYPVKSLAGIALSTARAEVRGLAFDRRWMLVDEAGEFLSQRELPAMALLQPELEDGCLSIRDRQERLSPLVINLPPYDGPADLPVRIWDDQVTAQTVDPEADAWFSKALGLTCRLVYLPDHSFRPVDPQYGLPGDHVSFADGYPFLIIGESSLSDLNGRLPAPVPMDRFRPNLVFSGGAPYEEEHWKGFRIGDVAFRGAKVCGRCQVTTIDQATGETGKEPLRTLAAYRREGNKIKFGLNACLDSPSGGILRVGDSVEKFAAHD